jgi:hypothetical protein
VLAKPLPEDLPTLTVQQPNSQKALLDDDFALFIRKKRKDDEASEDHSSKRNKIEKSHEEDFEMVNVNT